MSTSLFESITFISITYGSMMDGSKKNTGGCYSFLIFASINTGMLIISGFDIHVVHITSQKEWKVIVLKTNHLA